MEPDCPSRHPESLLGGTSLRISTQRLNELTASTGYRAEIVEKVAQLLTILREFVEHPYLRHRLVLKGGTALNLFVFDLPRLSVDIDLNYVGSHDREVMLAERPDLEQAITATCGRLEFGIQRVPAEHAGGKWRLRYQTSATQGANLEVDLNLMLRRPMWPIQRLDSRLVGGYGAHGVPVLDIHELAAGKLAALLSRHAGRDLFDAHRLLTAGMLEREKLRLAFVVYGAMNRKDWRTVSIDDVGFDPQELREMLLPVLRTDFLGTVGDFDAWAQSLVEECRSALAAVLPLSGNETEFLDRVMDRGEIVPSLLTTETEMMDIIALQPMLQWKAQNVRQHKGLG